MNKITEARSLIRTFFAHRAAVEELQSYAERKELTIHTESKAVLERLSGKRPHQVSERLSTLSASLMHCSGVHRVWFWTLSH